MNLKQLISHLKKIEKRYGDLEVELHHPMEHKGEVFMRPADINLVAVATYPEEREGKKLIHPKEKVVVIK